MVMVCIKTECFCVFQINLIVHVIGIHFVYYIYKQSAGDVDKEIEIQNNMYICIFGFIENYRPL